MGPSNYPPGVTGAEPQITGEPDCTPEAPWWVGRNTAEPGLDRRLRRPRRGDWAIYFGPAGHENGGPSFGPYLSQVVAEQIAMLLNSAWVPDTGAAYLPGGRAYGD